MEQINKVIHGDNSAAVALLTRGSVDLIVTSPPYDDLRTYEGHSWNFYGLAHALFQALAEGGVMAWVVSDQTIEGSESLSSMKQALHFKEIGFRIHDTMIWEKPNPMPQNHARYEQAWEYIFVCSKGKPKTWNPVMVPAKNAGKISTGSFLRADGSRLEKSGNGKPIKSEKVHKNIWPITNPGNGTKHPAVFPDALAEMIISTWSNEGDLVLDPFAGSGTSLLTAQRMSRKFIGVELNESYVAICNQRLADQTAK